MILSRLLIAGLLLCGVVLPANAQAPLNFEASYVVRLYGLTIGKASFKGSVEGDRYEVDGSLASAGLARVFDRTNASATMTGRLSPGRVVPERFTLDYDQDGRRSKTDIAFRNGNVATTKISPEPRKSSKKLVPLRSGDLVSVADPVSATLLARGTPQQICGRTLRIFEGATRIDVELSLAATGFVYGVGNSAVTCKGRFIPVAGFERGNGTFEYMREHSDLEFVYAPADRGLYMLHSLSARTEIGRVEMRAQTRRIDN